jgi:hypothetical protein
VSNASSLESKLQQFTIRRFCFDDAAGVTQLVKGGPRDLYSPAEIVQLNGAEKLVSVVALDSAGQVIGHYALERPDLGCDGCGAKAVTLELPLVQRKLRRSAVAPKRPAFSSADWGLPSLQMAMPC